MIRLHTMIEAMQKDGLIRLQRAIEDYKCREIDPQNADVYYNRGLAEVKLQKHHQKGIKD